MRTPEQIEDAIHAAKERFDRKYLYNLSSEHKRALLPQWEFFLQQLKPLVTELKISINANARELAAKMNRGEWWE